MMIGPDSKHDNWPRNLSELNPMTRITFCLLLLLAPALVSTVAAQDEKTTEQRLQRLLKQYPEADTDKDGKLTAAEAQAHALVAQARNQPDNDKRYELYAKLEDKLLGENGAVPIIPIYWYTFVQLEKENIKDTYNLNLLDQVDLTKVKVQ